MDNIILKQYMEAFDEMPPISNTLNYEDEIYQKLMIQALKENKPITDEKLSKVLDEIETDTTLEESEDNDMQEEKIRKLLKEYGAEDVEIENFMKDLAEVKEDVEDIDDAHKDEVEGAKDYQEMKEENKLDENDETFEDIKEDEEEHQDYLFNAKNMALLKATEEGKDLILKAPKMAKDELEYEIKKYLEKNKK